MSSFMQQIIVNKSSVDMVIDCLMPRDRHEHICRSLCQDNGIFSESTDDSQALTAVCAHSTLPPLAVCTSLNQRPSIVSAFLER